MSSSSSLACSSSVVLLLVVVVLLWCPSSSSASGKGNDFYGDFDFTWGDGRARILDNGKVLTLSLDRASGSSIQSKSQFLFGRFDMQLKLVPGDSAGTVTSFYLSSHGSKHDEIDFEFLGNVSGEPYVLHTNIFTRGGGGREQQFYLWFDPTADFHNYSILWTPNHIILSVDGTPIRDFKNLESIGVPYPNKQAMRLYASIWNAEYWATRGGQVRTDWSKAPFVASYKNFHANACVWSEGKSSCNPSSSSSSSNSSASSSDHNNVDDWDAEEFDFIVQDSINWVQKNYMIYDYCSDLKKFPRGLPAECVVAVSKKTQYRKHLSDVTSWFCHCNPSLFFLFLCPPSSYVCYV